MQRRFPRAKGRFWFLQGFDVVEAFARIASYWTLDTDRDAADFLGAGTKESFIVPGSMEGGAGGGFGDKGSAAYHLVSPVADSPA